MKQNPMIDQDSREVAELEKTRFFYNKKIETY